MRKSTFAALIILWTASTGAAGFWLRETVIATVIENGLEQAALWLGVDRPSLVHTLAPWLTAAILLAIPLWIAFQLGRWEREQKSPLEIRYRRNDPTHVSPIPNPWPTAVRASRYNIEVVNNSSTRTIHNVVVGWDRTPFTHFIDTETHRSGHLLDGRDIHPKETVQVHLFGVSDETAETQSPTDVLFKTSAFTVRARGEDAAEVTAQFEFSPLHMPKVLRIR